MEMASNGEDIYVNMEMQPTSSAKESRTVESNGNNVYEDAAEWSSGDSIATTPEKKALCKEKLQMISIVFLVVSIVLFSASVALLVMMNLQNTEQIQTIEAENEESIQKLNLTDEDILKAIKDNQSQNEEQLRKLNSIDKETNNAIKDIRSQNEENHQKLNSSDQEIKKAIDDLQVEFDVNLQALNLSHQDLKNDSSEADDRLSQKIQDLSEKQQNDISQALTRISNVNSFLEKFLLATQWYRASDGWLYRRFSAGVTYTLAQNSCNRAGGMLLSRGLRSSTVTREIISNVFISGEKYWIGQNDISSEGSYVWPDGGSTNSAVVSWNSGEPNGGRSENCMEIFRFDNTRVYLNDASCDIGTLYICEMNLPALA